jgi:superfamily I DNA/RNA helicase
LIVKQLQKSRIPYIAPETLPGKGLPILERLATWLRDDRDNLALRECVEAMLNNGSLGVPSDRVRNEDKKRQREEAFSKVSTLWNSVLEKGTSFWNSLEEARSEDALLESIFTCLHEIRSIDQRDVPQFLHAASLALVPWKKLETLTEEILGWVNRSRSTLDYGASSMVRIMTMQGAKGLQADIVCVVGLEEEVMPRSGLTPDELAEQARLLYVSMTRAKEELHLFHARIRSGDVIFKQINHSSGGSHILEPSCFLTCLPKELIEPIYVR